MPAQCGDGAGGSAQGPGREGGGRPDHRRCERAAAGTGRTGRGTGRTGRGTGRTGRGTGRTGRGTGRTERGTGRTERGTGRTGCADRGADSGTGCLVSIHGGRRRIARAPGVLDPTGRRVPPQRRPHGPFHASLRNRHGTGQLSPHLGRPPDSGGEPQRRSGHASQGCGPRASPRSGWHPPRDQRRDKGCRRARSVVSGRRRQARVGRVRSLRAAVHRAEVELRKPWCAISSSSVSGSSLSVLNCGPDQRIG
jgi:hypothetical protein